MNIEDLLAELENPGSKKEVQAATKQEAVPEAFGPVLKTLPSRSKDTVCGICRRKLTPGDKNWCQTTETTNYWWCCSCVKS